MNRPPLQPSTPEEALQGLTHTYAEVLARELRYESDQEVAAYLDECAPELLEEPLSSITEQLIRAMIEPGDIIPRDREGDENFIYTMTKWKPVTNGTGKKFQELATKETILRLNIAHLRIIALIRQELQLLTRKFGLSLARVLAYFEIPIPGQIRMLLSRDEQEKLAEYESVMEESPSLARSPTATVETLLKIIRKELGKEGMHEKIAERRIQTASVRDAENFERSSEKMKPLYESWLAQEKFPHLLLHKILALRDGKIPLKKRSDL